MYVKKIKIFEGFCASHVENLVNEFLAKEISDAITILSVGYYEINGHFSCMVYYTQQEKSKENEL
ncbi:hypothetical protein V1L52_10110 [Treponema sp. HNW]|uniref:hypothetical protein n=1 Tax=Treponema sp. HNW TaxID=3116654 RepID=UPI003D0C7867